MQEEIRYFLNTDNWFDYAGFYQFVSNQNFKVFVEVGVWKGHSISFLGNLLRNKDVQIFAVDLWNETYEYENVPNLKRQKQFLYDIYRENIRSSGLQDRIQDIKMLSWEAASRFEDGGVDFVFIDADHSYEAVIKDIDAWLPKVRAGGIISGHDYFNPCGVKQAVDEKFGQRVRFNGSCWYVEL